MAPKKAGRRARRKPTAEERDPRWTSELRPAPGDLRILQAFLNTAEQEAGTDGEQDLAAWLQLWELMPRGASVTAEELAKAVELRDAVRAVIGSRPGSEARQQAAKLVNEATQSTPMVIRLDADGQGRFHPSSEGDDILGALGVLASMLVAAQAAGIWERLKICSWEACSAVFYDHSKNQSAVWCSRRCGRRSSSLAYRRRNLSRVRQRDRIGILARRWAGRA